MAKEIIKTNLKLSDKVSLKYNDRDVDMSLSDFKTFLDANLEPSSAVLTSSEPLQYKALISNTDTFTQSGLLVIGKEYVIPQQHGGDDFTNVGYVSDGDSFIATGTTPTTWTNSTKVHDIAASQPTVTELVNTCGTVNVSWYFNNITAGDFIINFNQVGLFADTLFAPYNFLLYYPLVKIDDDNAYTVVGTGHLTDYQVAFEIYS